METITVELEFDKATPGTHRFTEIDDGGVVKIRNLYLSKAFFGDKTPAGRIRVTIEAAG